jgi:hypothetical protein
MGGLETRTNVKPTVVKNSEFVSNLPLMVNQGRDEWKKATPFLRDSPKRANPGRLDDGAERDLNQKALGCERAVFLF